VVQYAIYICFRKRQLSKAFETRDAHEITRILTDAITADKLDRETTANKQYTAENVFMVAVKMGDPELVELLLDKVSKK
jgi:hypothetical protein